MDSIKKSVVIVLSLLIFAPFSNGATYKIKNGTVVNSDGVSQQNINTVNQQQTNYQINNNAGSKEEEEVIYSQAQTVNMQGKTNSNPIQTIANKVTPEPSDKKIEALKTKNEQYLNRPLPQVNPTEIWVKYGKDNDAQQHKIAIQTRKSTVNDCKITTYTATENYSIWCKNNPTYSFYYFSPSNPVLLKFDYISNINSTTAIRYSYMRERIFDNNSEWKLSTIAIQYPNTDFVYKIKSDGYTLQGYYIDDKYYEANGKYALTRYTRKL
ncbi:hypothetical protein IJS77_04400 [bacterium]|nr:hypothetical protein [bacterium]